MSREHNESGVLEGQASSGMGTMMSQRRGPRVRGPGNRGPTGPTNVYQMNHGFDPWRGGSTRWNKATLEYLNKLLKTMTQPPISGFWMSIPQSRGSTEKIIREWFERNENMNTSRAEVAAFRSLIRAYDKAMTGWTTNLKTSANIRKEVKDKEDEVSKLSAERDTLNRENQVLTIEIQRRDDYQAELELKNQDKEDRIKNLDHELKAKQAEIRRLAQSLNSRRSQQTTPGGTVIEDGRHHTTWSEDIARRERDEYLFNIANANNKADALKLENTELKVTIDRLRAGREPIDQMGDTGTSTGVVPSSSTGATALQATEQEYQDIIGGLNNEINGLKHDKAGLQTAIQALSTGNDEIFSREKERLQAECQALREQLSSQRSEMSRKIQQLTKDLKDLQDRYDKCKRRNSEYEKKIRRLEIDTDNEMNYIRQSIDTVRGSIDKSSPKLNRVAQWINQAVPASNSGNEACEKARSLVTKMDEELKETSTPSPEFVRNLKDELTNVFKPLEDVGDTLETNLREAKDASERTRKAGEELDYINQNILATQTRARTGLVSPATLRFEQDNSITQLERFLHQRKQEQKNAKGHSDIHVPSSRLQHISPSMKPKAERSRSGKSVYKERADDARNRERRERRDRVSDRPPHAVVYVGDKPSGDEPAAAGTGTSEKPSSIKPDQPQFETPPNKYPFEHEITSSEKNHIHAGDASERREPQISEADHPNSSRDLGSSSLQFSTLSDDDLDPKQLKIIRAYLEAIEIIQGITDEDRRKPDNSFLGPLVRAGAKHIRDLTVELWIHVGEPPDDVIRNQMVDHPQYLLAWLLGVLEDYSEMDFNDPNLDIEGPMGFLIWMDEAEEAFKDQIKALAASPEWQQHLVEEFERVFVKDANERHERATKLRTKYDKLEAELLEAKLSPAEDFYVLNCVKKHLDSGEGRKNIEGLVMEIAPVIEREHKLSQVTQELDKWLDEQEDWAERMTPSYIQPLQELEALLKKKIADENDTDDKTQLQSRLRRIETILRNRPISEVILGTTIKSPLEIVAANIRVNQDAVDDQFETRRRRIESLIREKTFELYATNSHSRHAEAACFCSLLKYFMPKVYYSALHDGCCGHGRMISPIKKGANVDTQPPNPKDAASARLGRVCQGHHGHGLLSASTTMVTVVCHILTAILWLVFFLAAHPWDVFGTILMLVSSPFDLLFHGLAWFRYFFSYIHWRFFPNSYAENYHSNTFVPDRPKPPPPTKRVPGQFPTNPTRRPETTGSPNIPQFDGANDTPERGENEPERRPSIDMFAPKDSGPQPADQEEEDDTSWPPPPEKPGRFTFSRYATSPASLIIHLSVIVTVVTSMVYLAVDQERRVWLSNNHWRRAYVNDMLEPFGRFDERARAWVNWGVVAFPVNAILRFLNRVYVHILPRNWTVVPWNTDRAVGSGTAGYGGITWGDRVGLGGEGQGRFGQSQAAGL